MEKEKMITGKTGKRKTGHIGWKVGSVVGVMLAISVVIAVAVCIKMYSSLVTSMQTKICVNGTNLLAYELERASEDDDMNQVLDDLKKRQGCEFTVFEGDTRVYSTVVKDGERVVGTKLPDNLVKIILKKGKTYVGEAKILGNDYLCSYVPTKNDDGEIDGLIFAGMSIAEAEKEMNQIVEDVIIIGAVVIVVCVLLLSFYLKKSVSNPLKKITLAAQRLEEGRLGLADGKQIRVGVNSNDEIGLLGDMFEDTITTLRSYIGEIDDVLSSIAKGDLTKEAHLDYRGDFLSIKESMDSILEALNQAMGQIVTSAGHVSDGSEQVSASAQTLAQGATEQASAVTEISTTIMNISEDAKMTSAASVEAGDYINQAGTQLGVSIENVKELNASMDCIADDSKQIGTIVATIENIAFQINILSLNAAVEAARAGEAGRGFAVVADEISNLALKSDEAAKATKELIERSSATISESGEAMNRVSQALELTGELAGNVTDKMGHVMEAVEKQTAAMEQVATGIDQISAVVENNSAISQECAAASEELSSQSSMLKESVSSFRIKKA